MDNVKLEQFEGPLDLLLRLIEERKLDITEISLAEVTEQFLQYLKQIETVNPTLLADYLAIAAKLLVIKSKAILPSLELPTDEEEEAGDLEGRLLLYRQFKEAAKAIKLIEARKLQGFEKADNFENKISFFPDPAANAEALHGFASKIVAALKELDLLPKAKIKEAISIQEKISDLKSRLKNQVQTKLSELVKGAKNKSEVIVTFLALLELIKQRVLSASQEGLFEDVIITQTPPETPNQ